MCGGYRYQRDAPQACLFLRKLGGCRRPIHLLPAPLLRVLDQIDQFRGLSHVVFPAPLSPRAEALLRGQAAGRVDSVDRGRRAAPACMAFVLETAVQGIIPQLGRFGNSERWLFGVEAPAA